MKQLTYVSSASDKMNEEQLINLLDRARTYNQQHGITGLLLYQEGNIIQVIEGGDSEVDTLFDKIKIDTRHKGIIVLLEEEVGKRFFPEWTMGYHNVTKDHIEGFSDFFVSDKSEDEEKIIAGRAKKLLLGFRERIK
ncbi:MAG: BLUF domain-containing protein [Gammaproteobacteria bacterium]